MGVLIHTLFGDDAIAKVLETAKGKTIRAIKVTTDHYEDGELIVTFDDCSLVLRDEGRSCCESRYMMTDDDLTAFVGAQFVDAELRDGPTTEDDWETKEQQFLLVNTSLGTFTVCTHNEHNGYYGGFWITASIRALD